MHEIQRSRANDALREQGIRQAIFADPYNVTWLTGYSRLIQAGPIPYVGGPELVTYEDGKFTLLLMEGLSAPRGVETNTYVGYIYETPFMGSENLAALLKSFAPNTSSVIGIESKSLPVFLSPPSFVSIDGLLDPLRQVKSAEEIEKLRRSFAFTDAGHAAVRKTLQPGMREIDLWVEISSVVEKAAGQRVAKAGDCVVSYRDDNSGGWPLDLSIRPGDSVIVDLALCVDGYWSDSCGTYYTQAPDRQKREIHNVVLDALEYAISLVKPGVIASQIDQRVREFITKAGYPAYPHHTGHGVGTSFHEEPRITPYNQQPLEAGMVIMLEPGIYIPREAAVRLEDAVLVTQNGAEILTHHEKNLV